MKRPSVELIDGTVFSGTATEFPNVSTDRRSVLGWTTNNTAQFSVLPVLSVTVNTTVKLPTVFGVPVTSPEVPLKFKPPGKP